MKAKKSTSKVPLMEIVPTTREIAKIFPTNAYNPDKYRLCIKGEPQRVAYTFKAGQYSSGDYCHRNEDIKALYVMDGTVFPDKLRMQVCHYNIDLLGGMVDSIQLARHGKIMTVALTIGATADNIKSPLIWQPRIYTLALKEELIKGGHKTHGPRHFDDTTYIDACFYFPVEGTINEKIAAAFKQLKTVFENTHNSLLKKALKFPAGLSKEVFEKTIKRFERK